MAMKIALIGIIYASTFSALAFNPSSHFSQSSTKVQVNDSVNNEKCTTRQRFLQNISKIITTTTTLQIVSASTRYTTFCANADVTNKIASQPALRYIKRSITSLQKLDFYASQNSYNEVLLGLRSPTLNELRKNALILIRGGDDGPERDNLVNSFADFVKELENLNTLASGGFRKTIKNAILLPALDECVAKLTIFSEVAERGAEIPLQNDEANYNPNAWMEKGLSSMEKGLSK
eukprot:CAMPEP_0194420988 /NCGR_PEP_ID=MMETSP0176-20130528/20281_1 /TAXON_ID=216777 /ORGANISM="Proboscia alata, Strain PI-D3" /LENGTH=233 /DNA_ID=CAMNT_0039228911 /DNA_START=3 /DNA_END=704 /DNA_ORIENTATION=-